MEGAVVTEKSPVQEAADYARLLVTEAINTDGEVSLPAISKDMVSHFKAIPGYDERLMQDVFQPILYDVAQRTVARTRGYVQFRDQVMAREAMASNVKVRVRSARWAHWLEHVGDKHVRLMDMTKADLTTAANERRRRGETEYRYAALWEQLGGRLADGQTVGDVFTDDDITTMAASLDVKINVKALTIRKKGK